MKCPKCQTENPASKSYCRECGAKLLGICPRCGSESLPRDRFCGVCGQKLPAKEPFERIEVPIEGERKQVTVLFSDLSGYTTMSERLDPEEVQEIMTRIFGETAQVVTKYEGFIEKFIGDAVMAFFGVPKAHEDDPVRAIRVAREIHSLVEGMNHQLREKVGQPLLMHTGINTGLVVTGGADPHRGTHEFAGDTINLASRLTSLARAGEILVGPETYRQSVAYFNFEDLEPTKIKGKEEVVRIYRVLSPRERPRRTRHFHGLRADLIGRKAQLAQIERALQRLREGKGTIFSICGEPGTGKSRLIEEFKATLDLKRIQWLEGHAHPYTENIPYFPLIDLLNRFWQIEEGDPPRKVREKIESGVERLIGKRGDLACYIGSLYALEDSEVEGMSPESWKSRIQEAVQAIFLPPIQMSPTVICLEDLHWSDPSFLDLLRVIPPGFKHPALLLCVYRPPFNLFTSDETNSMGKLYEEIRLRDLSPAEAQDMMESLLKTETLPADLRRFVQEKVEGNPFYLEEVIHSLIESETLIHDNAGWRLTRPIRESDIPSTIQGVISARLDRLERETKRVLQEASVIGRAFLYEILKRVTDFPDHIDQCLSDLERLDLIRTRSLEPDIEYMFNHTLTQEVVYNGLLRKERREIHERIARVMEQLFRGRLSESYETLAFHFRQGQSFHKAVDYLVKSGEKSLGRYALEESHQYFKDAFELLANQQDRRKEEEELLIDVLIKWAFVFYYRGDLRRLVDLLKAHESLAESLGDKARLGMLYAWLGFALCIRENYRDSYQYLGHALKLGEEIENQQIIGYACAWFTWTCAELGLLEEAIHFGKRAQEISRVFESDHFLYFISLSAMGQAYWHRGEASNGFETAKALLEHGEKRSNNRSLVWGHYIMGWSHFTEGDFSSAAARFQQAIQISTDPYYAQFPRLGLVYSYISKGQFQMADQDLHKVLNFSQEFGAEILGTPAQGLLGLVSVGKGHLSQGIKLLKTVQKIWLEKQRRCLYAASEYMLGRVYLEIGQRTTPISLSTIIRNAGFLLRAIPFVGRKAERHFNRSIEVAREIGAKGTLGRAYLDLGLLYRAKGKTNQARECLGMAVRVFEQCEAAIYVNQAREALRNLE